MPKRSGSGSITSYIEVFRKDKSENIDDLLYKSKVELSADILTLYSINQTYNQLQLYKVIGLSKPFGLIEQKQSWKGLVWRVAQKRDIVTLPDIWTESPSLVRQQLFIRENITSYSGIPVTKNGLILGILELFFRKEFQPGASWYRDLRIVAQLIVPILINNKH